MRVLIIEDEAPAFRRLQKVLEEIDSTIEIVEVIDSVEAAVSWVRTHQAPDLYFMDIQLSDGLSFEIFDQVRITQPVIFTTAFDEYMLKAFKVNSIDYLLKPIKFEDLNQSLKKFDTIKAQYQGADIHDVVRQIQLSGKDYKSRFLIKQQDRMISVQTDDIAFFQSRHGVVHLMTKEGRRFIMDQSLEEIQDVLDPSRYYRTNRQFVIAYDVISAVHKYHKGKLLVEIEPKSDDQVIVSAEKAPKFKAWLDQ